MVAGKQAQSGLPVILHYSELYSYCITNHNVIVIEMKYTVSALYSPEAICYLCLWKDCPMKSVLVPKKVMVTAISYLFTMVVQNLALFVNISMYLPLISNHNCRNLFQG